MENLERGDLVWGHWRKRIWWPAVVMNPEDCNQDCVAVHKKWLFWFGDHQISEISCKSIVLFEKNYDTKFDKKNKSVNYTRAVKEVLEVLATQYKVKCKDPDYLFQWAKNGFKHSTKCNHKKSDLPEVVYKCFDKDSFKRKSIDYSNSYEDYDTGREKEIKKLVLSIRNGFYNIKDICICCKSKNKVIAQHPLFLGGVCFYCFKIITQMRSLPLKPREEYCILCGKLGILLSCNNNMCRRSFCRLCVDYFVQEDLFFESLSDKNWFCYICKSDPDKNCLIKIYNLTEPKELTNDSPIPEKKFSLTVIAHTNRVLSILENKKLCVGKFCTFDAKQVFINMDDEEIKYKYLSQRKFREIGADLVCGGYFVPYKTGQQRKDYVNSFFTDFYGYLFPFNQAKLANPSMFFIYVSATEAFDSMMFNRVLRFLEVRPISVKCNQQLFSVWTNISNSRFLTGRTYSIKKKSAHETLEESIISYFIEPLKEHFESVL